MTAARALVAAVLVNLGLGTFYAWSVFIVPYESALGISRSEISTVFSLATVCFVAAMLFGPALQARLKASPLALLSTGMASVGLGLAGWAPSLAVVLIGYGILFGTANGLGYALALQVASQSFERRRSLAMGVVVATYAVGAAIGAPLLSGLVPRLGLAATLYTLAATVLLLGAVAALLLRDSTPLSQPSQHRDRDVRVGQPANSRLFAQMWFAYALGASAGLMMIGHATGIVEASGASAGAVVLGPVLVSIGNGLGRISAGWLGDLIPVRWVLTSATGLGAAALLMSYVAPSPLAALTTLAVMGSAYGILAAGYPVAVAEYFGPRRVATVYGRLFTAWGVGGVVGPFIAAEAFGASGDYAVAIAVAGGAALLATICTAFLPAKSCRRRAGV